jgi:hypothetical protein
MSVVGSGFSVVVVIASHYTSLFRFRVKRRLDR